MNERQPFACHCSATGLIVASLAAALTVGCGSSGAPADPPATTPEAEVLPEPVPEPETPEREDPAETCSDSFDGAYQAIQAVIFEGHGCDFDSCHGSAAAGNLDLRAEHSYENLISAPSTGSTLLRVQPTKVKDSYLFQKLAAATEPSFVTIQLAGSAMPPNDDILSRNELEAVRLWIEGGAPQEGSIGDEFGGNRVAELLDACLPPPDPVEVIPLEPPAPGRGVQLAMPPHRIPAGREFEVCFAEYIDLRDQIPDRFRTSDGKAFFANGSRELADPNTHHLTLAFSGFGADMVDAPEFGRWECAAGPFAGNDCDPLDKDHCGGGPCRSELQGNPACIGFGPPGGNDGATPGARVDTANGRPGFFAEFPSHGIFYWNSHSFNLTATDLTHHNYTNVYFTDDLRFEAIGFQDTSRIFVAAGTPPFERAEYCHEYVLAQGTQLLSLFSHTHKRGERFTIDLKSTGERLYDNPFWDDPVIVKYDPPRLFASDDPDDRTLVYCALYNNGVAADGSPDVGLVTRLSRKPDRSTCTPVACTKGRVTAPCNGVEDHAACDSSPGAGDGFCDACPITGGLTSDDEMDVLLGTFLRPVSD